jgi:hypothetical protein
MNTIPDDELIRVMLDARKAWEYNPRDTSHVYAFIGRAVLALAEQRQAAKVAELEARIAELEAAQPAALLPFSDALRIARGCTDYGGGYRGTEHYGAYQDGIKTVIASLEAAFRKGLSDPQVAALRAIGAQEEQAAPKPAQVSEPVALDSHNGMTAWTPELRDQRVSAKGFHAARAVIGTTSLDDDRIVYRALQAYLYAAQPAKVAAPLQADGWQWVPMDATEEMCRAIAESEMPGSWDAASERDRSESLVHMRGWWRAMLAAAPKREGGV